MLKKIEIGLRAIMTILLTLYVATGSAYSIAIHGGAGTLDKEKMTPKLRALYESILKQSLDTGYKVLQQGGKSEDAVVQAITVLEDSPLFNAGKGAAYTEDAHHVLEASIISGNDHSVGSVVQLSHIKNPIQLARAVQKSRSSVMLAGKSAEDFATQHKFKLVDNHYFDSKERFQLLRQWQAALPKRKQITDQRQIFGTVGAVAVDQQGRMAAGTSTGGLTGKLNGRIGDSPIIGAGTFANEHCAVSTTGHGEDFIRTHLASDICDRALYGKLPVARAAEISFKAFTNLHGRGGIIVLDEKGRSYFNFNSKGMYRGVKSSNGLNWVDIY